MGSPVSSVREASVLNYSATSPISGVIFPAIISDSSFCYCWGLGGVPLRHSDGGVRWKRPPDSGDVTAETFGAFLYPTSVSVSSARKGPAGLPASYPTSGDKTGRHLFLCVMCSIGRRNGLQEVRRSAFPPEFWGASPSSGLLFTVPLLAASLLCSQLPCWKPPSISSLHLNPPDPLPAL